MNNELKNMPKVELHLHLDGSIRLKTLEKFQSDDVKEKVVAKEKCDNLTEYLTKFEIPVQYLQKIEAIENACYELSEDLKEDGVIYAEVRFSPFKLLNPNISLDDIITSAIRGFLKGKIKIGIILCMMRNDSIENNKKIIELAEKFKEKGVVAVDLAGDEINYPTSQFKELFLLAEKKGIPFTIHAGEINSKESLESALNYHPSRLGHGINCIYYPNILHQIVEQQILLEVCPTSNVQTNVVSKYKEHPILQLKEAGCKICINTDNRTVSNITLTQEYQKLIENFSFTINDFCNWNINAIDYAFLTKEEKDQLKRVIINYSGNYK